MMMVANLRPAANLCREAVARKLDRETPMQSELRNRSEIMSCQVR